MRKELFLWLAVSPRGGMSKRRWYSRESSSDSKARVLIPLRKCCLEYSRTCEFIAKTALGQSPRKSLGKGLSLRSPRIQLSLAEVSLVKLATDSPSRKGAVGYLPRIESKPREGGEKCTAYPNERRMLMAVLRTVPWSGGREQGEIL